MNFIFNVKKTVQSLAYLLQQMDVLKINILKAQKLLYLADRAALDEALTLITGDMAFAMAKGPVLSQTYDLMKTTGDWPDPSDEEIYWTTHFGRDGHDIVLLRHPGEDELSRFDKKILDKTILEFGHRDQYDLVAYTHQLPEWRKNTCGNSAAPIPLEDILTALGKAAFLNDVLEMIHSDQELEKLCNSVG